MAIKLYSVEKAAADKYEAMHTSDRQRLPRFEVMPVIELDGVEFAIRFDIVDCKFMARELLQSERLLRGR